MWWLSTRTVLRSGDPEWNAYFFNHPFPQVRELRTIDSWFNRPVDACGSYAVAELADLPSMMELVPTPVPGKTYYLLFTDATDDPPEETTGLKLLGHDLSDETWTSSLTNCGMWQGELEPLARRVNEFGLLGRADALAARALLPSAWPGDPHGITTVWALFEVGAGGTD